MVVWAIGAAVAVMIFVGWLARRWDRDVDSYHEREYGNPVIFGSGNLLH